jgi:hypothetical protein
MNVQYKCFELLFQCKLKMVQLKELTNSNESVPFFRKFQDLRFKYYVFNQLKDLRSKLHSVQEDIEKRKYFEEGSKVLSNLQTINFRLEKVHQNLQTYLKNAHN